jgi:hypothetical protein
MDTSTAITFKEIRDSLRPATIATLIDLADGATLSAYRTPLIYAALESRKLIEVVWIGEPYTLGSGRTVLTELGRAWLAWYRNPQDLPAQLDMFDAL